MLDCHVHIRTDNVKADDFRGKLQAASGRGAIVLSLSPETPYSFDERLGNVLSWRDDAKEIYPFFWLDPLAADADRQVEFAFEKGIAGFKVICERFYASDERAMRIFGLIASLGKPVLFHSGILWDGKVSSKYNRPLEFECLLEVPDLRFALAHVGWPWCDELIALYGKFLHTLNLNQEHAPEMFIDTTPGTPVIYREEVLKKLYKVGYDIEDNIIFGLDSCADKYNSKWAREWQDRDRKILQDLGLDEEKIEKYFYGNTRKFLGIDKSSHNRKLPLVGSD